MKQISSHSGFSVIEIITVLLLLMTLSVVALPKFLNAEEAAVESSRIHVPLALEASVELVKQKWLLEGKPQNLNNQTGPQVTLNSTLLVTVDQDTGLPVGTAGRDRARNMSLQDCADVFNDLVEHSFLVRHRGQVNNSNFDEFDVIVTRTNSNPDVCNYYWSDSLTSRPNNALPTRGNGFQYFTHSGEISRFNFS